MPTLDIVIWSGFNSGLLGLCFSLIFWTSFAGTEEGVYRLVGYSGLMGLGGVTATEVLERVKGMIFKVDDAKPSVRQTDPDSDLIA